MTPEELLEHAMVFTFTPVEIDDQVLNRNDFRLNVERRGLGDSWAVVHFGEVWDGKQWVYENIPSNRTDEFKALTRFPLATAVDLAVQLVETVTVNGATYAQWWDRFAAKKAAETEKDK